MGSVGVLEALEELLLSELDELLDSDELLALEEELPDGLLELEEELLDGLLELEEPPPAPLPEVLSEDALELLLEEVELLEPLFPPPPPPPPLQAVSMETDTAAASTTAMTLSDNLMINSSHFSESRRETLFSHPFQQHTPPHAICQHLFPILGYRTKIGLISHQFDHERIFILRF